MINQKEYIPIILRNANIAFRSIASRDGEKKPKSRDEYFTQKKLATIFNLPAIKQETSAGEKRDFPLVWPSAWTRAAQAINKKPRVNPWFFL